MQGMMWLSLFAALAVSAVHAQVAAPPGNPSQPAHGHQGPPPNCPPMWSGSGDQCYQFFKETLTWPEAREFCARFASCATGAAASMVHLRVATDETRLESFLAPKGDPVPPNVWLGLGDAAGSGSPTWPDGSAVLPASYQNFGQGARNGNCVLKDMRTGQWAYAQCTQRNAFVCQMERMHVVKEPATVPPGTGAPI